MLKLKSLATALVAVLAVGGCDLDVENPNAPDAPRAFADPAGLAQLLGGAFRTWVATRGDYFIMALNAQADNYTASWNNAAMRFYSSVGRECPSRCGWTNSATADEAAGGPTVEASWYGYYTVLSSANDVLRGIAAGICFDDDCTADNTLTSRNRAIAKMLQGMAFAGIALLYDQGFAADETVELPDDPTAYPAFSSREVLRDSALAKFEQAYTEAGLKTWSTPAPPNSWFGAGSGKAYTNTQIRQVIRTMQAELLAMYPRNAAENALVDWAQVATSASQGISSAPPFDFEFFIDITGRECGLDCIKTWGNSILTARVDTRVAAMLTTNHVDPWPEPAGNPCPTISSDKRVGDGTYGSTDNEDWATSARTANAGTDFACSEVPLFDPARGQYHQSNLQHVRYYYLAYCTFGEAEDCDGTGQDPFYTVQMNDLLWAEGLIRSGGDLNLAATLINNSRVGRGNLSPPASGSDPPATVLGYLQYEQEIEFMGQGVTPFFNRRRSGFNATLPGGTQTGADRVYVDGLIVGTPRHMPVPAREQFVLVREIYTFGGPSLPDMSAAANPGGGDGRSGVRTVRDIWQEYLALRQASRRF